jgi:4-aminobutyrate aminotransferase-like enzyme
LEFLIWNFVLTSFVLPNLLTPIPGPESLRLAERLKAVECRNTTYLAADWPVFWEKAEGVNVWDADGNRLLDFTSAFGVATLGHGFSAKAGADQANRLVHAMGDVHPARLKVELCERLSALTFERWIGETGKTLLGNSGFEAVEAALKTAVMVTGKSGIVSFEGAYHGLGYGALLGAGIEWFRKPFERQLSPVTIRLPYPRLGDGDSWECFLTALKSVEPADIGALLVEPMQGRGGIVIPPVEFLRELRRWCDQHGVVLIFDEIYTGLNRTGKLFGCDGAGVVPDLICLGKSLSGGFPISACVGRAAIMDAWPETHGEALHTSTFLGNPLGCAMAITSLKEHAKVSVIETARKAGEVLGLGLSGLIGEPFVFETRGVGLMQAVELRHPDGNPAGDICIELVKGLLRDGILALPDAPEGHVLALTPPSGISDEEIAFVVERIRKRLLQSCAR